MYIQLHFLKQVHLNQHLVWSQLNSIQTEYNFLYKLSYCKHLSKCNTITLSAVRSE